MNHTYNSPCVSTYYVAESFQENNKLAITGNKLYEKIDGQYSVTKTLSYAEVIQFAKDVMSENINHAAAVDGPDSMRNYLSLQLGSHERELFGVVFLNNNRQPIAFEVLFYGTLAGAEVCPREVLKRAIANNAAAVILAHNHPSSNVKPSQADIQITHKIISVLRCVDIRVLDHFIVSNGMSYSLTENNDM